MKPICFTQRLQRKKLQEKKTRKIKYLHHAIREFIGQYVAIDLSKRRQPAQHTTRLSYAK